MVVENDPNISIQSESRLSSDILLTNDGVRRDCQLLAEWAHHPNQGQTFFRTMRLVTNYILASTHPDDTWREIVTSPQLYKVIGKTNTEIGQLITQMQRSSKNPMEIFLEYLSITLEPDSQTGKLKPNMEKTRMMVDYEKIKREEGSLKADTFLRECAARLGRPIVDDDSQRVEIMSWIDNLSHELRTPLTNIWGRFGAIRETITSQTAGANTIDVQPEIQGVNFGLLFKDIIRLINVIDNLEALLTYKAFEGKTPGTVRLFEPPLTLTQEQFKQTDQWVLRVDVNTISTWPVAECD